jgi:hypothetical protein
MIAMGAVAHEVEGASLVPTKEPASTKSVIIEPPSALLMLSMQTFLKPGLDMMLIGKFLLVDCWLIILRNGTF